MEKYDYFREKKKELHSEMIETLRNLCETRKDKVIKFVNPVKLRTYSYTRDPLECIAVGIVDYTLKVWIPEFSSWGLVEYNDNIVLCSIDTLVCEAEISLKLEQL